jgi:Uma2 family endonuclease
MAQQVTRHRLSVDDYHRMAEAGILSEDDRVELIKGEILDMSPIGGPHMTCVNLLNDILVPAVREHAFVSVQNPVRLGEHSEPEPDVALLVRRDYGRSVPSAEDVLLIIEVSDSTLAHDRDVKMPLYAQAGIPQAFLIDLANEMVYRYSEPHGHIYRFIEQFRRGDRVLIEVPPAIRVEIEIDKLLA